MDIGDEGRGGIKDDFKVSSLFNGMAVSLSKIEAVSYRRRSLAENRIIIKTSENSFILL